MMKGFVALVVLAVWGVGTAASMEDILASARKAKKPGEVRVPAGTYYIEKTLTLGPDDSGLRFVADGEVTISGGREVSGWRLHEPGVWVADVPWVTPSNSVRLLTVNGVPRTLARSPNRPKAGGYHVAWGGGGKRLDYAPGTFDPAWQDVENGEVTLYHFWTDTHCRLKRVLTNRVEFVSPARKGFGTGVRNNEPGGNNAWYLIENLYPLMDEPGEWCVDEKRAKIYYRALRGEDPTKVRVVVPAVETLVEVAGRPAEDGRWATDISFEGFRFADAAYTLPFSDVNDAQASEKVGAAVRLSGARRCVFRNCRFENLSAYAFHFGKGTSDCALEGSRLSWLGAGGVRLCGARDEIAPFEVCRGNRIVGCTIEHYGRRYLSGVGILVQHASGTLVKGCRIHDGFYTGVSLGWSWGYRHSVARDNVIEGNEISLIGQGVLSDMGGIYSLGLSPGSVIRGNRVHDVDARCYGGWGIYNDEGTSDMLIENNVVWNTKFAGFFIHYARESVVRNNVFALGRLEQLSLSIPERHTTLYFYDNIVYWKTGKLFEGNWGEHTYHFYWHPRYEPEDRSDWIRLDRNVYFNPGKKLADVNFGEDVLNCETNGVDFASWQARGHDRRSLWADPGFVDPENGDFTLKPDSPAFRLGFSAEGVPLKSIDQVK